MAGAGRAVEVVPPAQPPLLLLDDEQALAGEHEEPLLRVLVVIERVRIAGPQDAHVDADVAERRFPWLERVERASLLKAHGERLLEIVDEPALRRDVAAVGRFLGVRFLDCHRLLLVVVRRRLYERPVNMSN